jgi:hypothetical protein
MSSGAARGELESLKAARSSGVSKDMGFNAKAQDTKARSFKMVRAFSV